MFRDSGLGFRDLKIHAGRRSNILSLVDSNSNFQDCRLDFQSECLPTLRTAFIGTSRRRPIVPVSVQDHSYYSAITELCRSSFYTVILYYTAIRTPSRCIKYEPDTALFRIEERRQSIDQRKTSIRIVVDGIPFAVVDTCLLWLLARWGLRIILHRLRPDRGLWEARLLTTFRISFAGLSC